MKAFAGVHPLVLLIYFLSVLIVTMFVTNPVLSLLALLGAVLFCTTGARRDTVAGDIGFYLPMFLLVAITNPLFSHNGVTPLFFLNGNPVTLEAFVYGAAIAVTVIGAMLRAREGLRTESARLHRRMLAVVRGDATCRRLMTAPGVGEAAS